MKIHIEILKKIEEEFGQFEIGRIIGNDNHNYLKFGYWKPVDESKLSQILGSQLVVSVAEDYDEDCGWIYSYTLYDHSEWDIIKRKRQSEWCSYSGMASPVAYIEKKS
jgi:nicotinic acid mononucleotide adenylyltransferase